MAKSKSRETPMYTVWRPDLGETEDQGKQYGALDVECAAELYAAYCHRHRDGWEWSWPVVFYVKDPDGKVFAVTVERESVPEFNAGCPMPLPMERACHVLWDGRALCEDPRLGDHWPDNQKFFTVGNLQRGDALVSEITCKGCQSRAPGLLEGLRGIRAGVP